VETHPHGRMSPLTYSTRVGFTWHKASLPGQIRCPHTYTYLRRHPEHPFMATLRTRHPHK